MSFGSESSFTNLTLYLTATSGTQMTRLCCGTRTSQEWIPILDTPERGTNLEWHLTPRGPRTLRTQRPTLTFLVLTRTAVVKPRKSTTSLLTTLSRLRNTHSQKLLQHRPRVSKPIAASMLEKHDWVNAVLRDQCFSRVVAQSLTRQKEAQAASVRLTAREGHVLCQLNDHIGVFSVNMPLCKQRGEPEPGDRSREDIQRPYSLLRENTNFF